MSKATALAFATGAPVETPKELVTPPAEAALGNPSEPPKDELVSTRIAQIAKKEARFREEQESHKKRMTDLQEKESKFTPFYEKYRQFEELKGKDPVAAIKLLGFSDTDYINFVAASEDKSTPEERAEKIASAKIEEFRKEQETKAQQEESRRNEESISGFKKNINITVKANAERFELCNYYGEAAEALIMKTVQEAYQKDIETNPDAEPLSAEKAAELVEGYYEEFHREANKLKKFQPKEELEEKEEPVAKKQEEPLKAQVSPGMPPKTLTNKVAPSSGAPPASKRETPNDKRERLKKWLATGVKP